MAHRPEHSATGGWQDVVGLPHILRTLAIAIQPAKLVLALAGIVSTFAWGWALDLAWSPVVSLDDNAIGSYIVARDLGMPYAETEGDRGVFQVFQAHQRSAIVALMASILPGDSVAPALAAERSPGVHASPASNLLAIVYGVLWMVRFHPFYFILFALGVIAIWALFGGAICRMAALQFTREELPTLREGVVFARNRWFGGFFLAPLFPAMLVLGAVVALALGGAILRIPVLGDIIAGTLFFLAILGGFFAAVILVGLFVGGSLLWPAVATEGFDAFDSFSRAVSYPYNRPLKAVIYAALLLVYASVCWLALSVFVYLSLAIARTAVGFGTSPFGWWARGDGGARKIDVLWPMNGPNQLWSSPDWAGLAWYEYISAALIAVYVVLVIGLLWSFLCSFYFSGSTVAYCLLRRDVDLIDLKEVYVGDEDTASTDPAPRPSSQTPAEAKGGNIALPIAGETTVKPPDPSLK